MSCWHCDKAGCPGSALGECPEEKIMIETSQGTVTVYTSESLGRNEVRAYSIDPSFHAQLLRIEERKNTRKIQAEADEWYAAEVERMKERAPA